jgi:ATP-dependent DNA ligase
MLCETATMDEAKELLATDKWLFEQKVDGVRGYIKDGKLYDRRGKEITARFPEFTGLDKLRGIWDGEIICASNEFGHVAGRMHVRDPFVRKLLVKQNPARFVLFDILDNEQDAAQLWQRKQRIKQLADDGQLFTWMIPLPWQQSGFEERWQQVQDLGEEGIVIKERHSLYQQKRSTSWRKVKSFVEATAVFVKLEVHPRGVRLETKDGKSVNVNGAQAQEVLDLFQQRGEVTCNVQYMRQKDSDAWRFPSYRGGLI